ncbi:unnamed protein product, partial [Mesorhabditis spiculigera]
MMEIYKHFLNLRLVKEVKNQGASSYAALAEIDSHWASPFHWDVRFLAEDAASIFSPQTLLGVKKASKDPIPGHSYETYPVAEPAPVRIEVYGRALPKAGFFFAADCNASRRYEAATTKTNILRDVPDGDIVTVILKVDFTDVPDNTLLQLCHKTDPVKPVELVPGSKPTTLLIKSEEGGTPWQIIVLICIVLVMFSGIFSGLNFALVCLSVKHLDLISRYAASNDRKYARSLIRLRKHGNLIICTFATLNVIVNTVFALESEKLFPERLGLWGAVLGLLLPTSIIVVFGELLPQAICYRRGLLIASKTRYFAWACIFILSPICWPLAKLIDVVLGRDMAKYNFEEAQALLDQNMRNMPGEGILAKAKKLQRTVVGSVLTTVDQTFRLSADDVLDAQMLSTIAEKGYTRIPIFDANCAITRYVLNTRVFFGNRASHFVKDLLTITPSPKLTIKTYLTKQSPANKQEVRVVLADAPVSAVLLEMLRSQNHFYAVVRCDAGPYQLLGYVSLEDLMEEVFGEIQDGSDSVWSTNRRAKGHEDQSILDWLREPIGPGEIPQHAKLKLIQILFSCAPILKQMGFDFRMAHQALNSSALFRASADVVVSKQGQPNRRIIVLYSGSASINGKLVQAPHVYGAAVIEKFLSVKKDSIFYCLTPEDFLNQLISSTRKTFAKEFLIGLAGENKHGPIVRPRETLPEPFELLKDKLHPTESKGGAWRRADPKLLEKSFRLKAPPDETQEWTTVDEEDPILEQLDATQSEMDKTPTPVSSSVTSVRSKKKPAITALAPILRHAHEPVVPGDEEREKLIKHQEVKSADRTLKKKKAEETKHQEVKSADRTLKKKKAEETKHHEVKGADPTKKEKKKLPEDPQKTRDPSSKQPSPNSTLQLTPGHPPRQRHLNRHGRNARKN